MAFGCVSQAIEAHQASQRKAKQQTTFRPQLPFTLLFAHHIPRRDHARRSTSTYSHSLASEICQVAALLEAVARPLTPASAPPPLSLSLPSRRRALCFHQRSPTTRRSRPDEHPPTRRPPHRSSVQQPPTGGVWTRSRSCSSTRRRTRTCRATISTTLQRSQSRVSPTRTALSMLCA